MTKQTRLQSAIEALTNILIGALVSLIAQLVWFPAIGKDFTMTENLWTTAFLRLLALSVRMLFVAGSLVGVVRRRFDVSIYTSTNARK